MDAPNIPPVQIAPENSAACLYSGIGIQAANVPGHQRIIRADDFTSGMVSG